jgi:hypothetical protein
MATVYLIESLTETQRLTKQGCLSILIQATCIKIDKQPCLVSLWVSVEDSIRQTVARIGKTAQCTEMANSLC